MGTSPNFPQVAFLDRFIGNYDPGTGLEGPVQASKESIAAQIETINGLTSGVISIVDKDLTAPPVSPAIGARYIVAATATGAWATHEEDIAQYSALGWTFTDPTGATVYVEDEAAIYHYLAGTWTKQASDAAAAAAAASAAAALVSENNAAASEANADDAEAGAIAARLAAESARDTALVNANIYTSTGAGISATTNGQQFGVVDGEFIQRYVNNSGVADPVPGAKIPTAAYLRKTPITITASRALTTSDGNRLLHVNIPGPVDNSIAHLRIPTNAADPISIGESYEILRVGGSIARVVPDAGVALTKPVAADLVSDFSWAKLRKTGTDAWTLYGVVSAAPSGAHTSKIWFDPSDLSTMFVERTGASATTPASVDGPVGSWRNKGVIGGWATAPADDRRPTLRTDGTFYWLEFDGSLTAGQGGELRLPLPALDLATIEMYIGVEVASWASGQSGIVTFAPVPVGTPGVDILSDAGMAFFINNAEHLIACRGQSMLVETRGVMPAPHVYEFKKPNNSTASLSCDNSLVSVGAVDSTITHTFTAMGGDLIIGARYGSGAPPAPYAHGNMNLYQLIIKNEVTADSTPLREYVEQKTYGTVPVYPTISDTTELEAARATLISEVFATVGGVIPTDVATMDLETPPVSGLTSLATCHKLTIPGYAARPRLWTPTSPRDDAILFVCAGHSATLTNNALSSVPLQSALTRGVRVVTFMLPGGPNDLTSGGPADHESAHPPMSDWAGPVSIVINTLEAMFPTAAFYVTGISGGGWMTMLCAATDVRFKGSYQFVGTMPDYYYYERDWEGRRPGLTATNMDMYLMAGCPSPRRHKHILHENDGDVFKRTLYETRPPWDAQLAIQAASIGGGYYALVWDNWNQHAFHNPFFTTNVLDEIAPLP